MKTFAQFALLPALAWCFPAGNAKIQDTRAKRRTTDSTHSKLASATGHFSADDADSPAHAAPF
jgi:hypothetical protein